MTIYGFTKFVVYTGIFVVFMLGGVEANNAPTASIDSIIPNPAHEGAQVNFTGSGTDSDGNIVGYQWRSSLDGADRWGRPIPVRSARN